MTTAERQRLFEGELLSGWLTLYYILDRTAPLWFFDGIGALCGPSYNDYYTHKQAMADFFKAKRKVKL